MFGIESKLDAAGGDVLHLHFRIFDFTVWIRINTSVLTPKVKAWLLLLLDIEVFLCD
jgi:hypothetical protein